LTNRSLHGRAALVTGGGRGIGAAIVRELAGAGATVAINYNACDEDARRLAAQLGAGAAVWQANVSDAEQARRLVDAVQAAHEGIDILVLNAGVWRGGRIERVRPDDCAWFSAPRSTAPTRSAARPFRGCGRGFGRIVVVSSVIGLVGYPGDSAYASAKAGLLGLDRSLSKELGPDGITVNAVLPGFIDTEMTAAVPIESRERMIARTSLGRAGRAEEVAAAVRFLVAEGSYITGRSLVVDGGFSL
jgi:3-oxoacyl-[acyl-carrier protein] reductase